MGVAILAKATGDRKGPSARPCRYTARVQRAKPASGAVARLSALRPSGGADRLTAPDATTLRELYFFELYRVFEATLFVGFVFSPLADRVIAVEAPWAARIAALVYLVCSAMVFLAGRRNNGPANLRVLLGLALDVLAFAVALYSLRGIDSGVALLMLLNVSCGALLMPAVTAYAVAVLAALGVAITIGFGSGEPGDTRNWTEAGLFAASYLAAAILCQLLRREHTETRQRVQQQEIDLANLTQLNEMIIRRMRTGVLVVDANNRIHQRNEAAWHLMGNPPQAKRELGEAAPELSRRLYHWRTFGKADTVPVALADGLPEVIPRFARLGAEDNDNVIIFLDDTSLLSRQAEQLTLMSLGRLSASVAHEIRNPLAAISYSSQLLAESEQIPEADKRLIDIVRQQCQRVNSIVENILQLSRRERSRPEPFDLVSWANNFVEDYKSSNPMGADELRAVLAPRSVQVLADPGQLQQVAWNLVQNARRYGRLPDQPARVAVVARRLNENGPPVLEIVDRGPGIPQRVADQIFDPFYTTHEHGTGLGLYIAKQLTEANQANLEYVPVAGGGACFRITLAAAVSPASARQRAASAH